ncbi:nuclear transport factor 2 family protein [uncultured Jatrophihabitans sp.]|uniref:nuclear transport factor 2 family protein n=1 Tax=uncultured Jatrophihabitans sp. TaxID=1610747 RepID=UPI0035C965F8
MTIDVSKWLDDYRIAWETRDPDAAAALFTEDSLYREQAYQEAFAGAQGVKEYWINVTATQSDVKIEWGTPLVVDDHAAVEWWVNLKNAGADITLAGEFMLIFAEDGRCKELREYWFFGEGALRPPSGWGA